MRLRLFFAILGAAAITVANAATPYDASVAVQLDWAQGTRGGQVLRDDIARAAIDALSGRGCFRDIQTGEPADGSDLQLDVELWDLIEETEFDDSMAERVDPTRPKPALRLTASFSVFVGWTLRAGENQIVQKRFKIDRHRRPLTETEDTAALLRDESIEVISRELTRAVCGVSHKKIDAARAAAR